MAKQVGPARGMRDFLPSEKRRRDRVLTTIQQAYGRHGFEPIETPAVEDHETLHSGLGGDNEKLSFGILRRGLDASDLSAAADPSELADLGLRFDLTVPLARYVASHQHELPEVFRALHIGPVWRAERPQKGRFRQFVQCDIDIVGEASTLAEREVLLATASALDELGVGGYQFRVNDRRLLAAALSAAGVPEDRQLSVLITLDKLDKVGPDGVMAEIDTHHAGAFDPGALKEFVERASKPVQLTASAIAAVMSAPEELAEQISSWVHDVAEIIGAERFVFDPVLVRGMGYYTGSIIELAHPDSGVSLGGGGRYDQMVGRFLGTDVPAVGFSLGFERLVDLVESVDDDGGQRVALVFDDDVASADLVRIKRELIDQGRSVTLVRAKKNMKSVYGSLADRGFDSVGHLQSGEAAGDIDWRPLSHSR